MFNKKQNKDKKKIILNNDYSIFKFIEPENNDKFSDMSGLDLQELFQCLDNYYLELRSELGLDSNVTFGLELEFENIKQRLSEFNLLRDWNIKSDGSLHRGGEINSPILTDMRDSWTDLEYICSVVKENAVIDKKSGGHIHVGAHIIGDNIESWLNFIKTWAIYENIIYRFSYGEYLCGRSCLEYYAHPISKQLLEHYDYFKKEKDIELEKIIRKLAYERYQGINFGNCRNYEEMVNGNTIEFRCPNGTLEPAIWQNNVNLFVNLLLYSKSSNFNDDIIEKRRIIKGDKYSNLDLYGEIFLDQALELCDMLFTNNLDKIYFLRQYLKSFETSENILEKAKIFVKTK